MDIEKLSLQMPSGYWGKWQLGFATELLKVDNITVVRCSAMEPVDDENGVPAQRTLYHDPCARALVLGQADDGTVVWSRQLHPFHQDTTVITMGTDLLLIGQSETHRIDGATSTEKPVDLLYHNVDFDNRCRSIIPDLQAFDEELLLYISRNPDILHELRHRQFEELLESIFRNLGYNTQLGPGRGDRGVDLLLLQKDSIGEIVTLVQAKKYAAKYPIKLEAVSALYGVVQNRNANRGLFVTTSRYLPCAADFAKQIGSRLTLATSMDVAKWCAKAAESNKLKGRHS